ncbi:hypothetical protein H6H01_13140 [Nostoc calcicola FACHB-3891]|nr:hypothetical protein [Nostoc calcicola FACHB-3891]
MNKNIYSHCERTPSEYAAFVWDFVYLEKTIQGQLVNFLEPVRALVLSWDGDKFALTCGNIGLAGTNKLPAECERADKETYLATYINLDEHIANIDGKLKFE